eukprot:CAMPEP_0175882300 /NCGR_PEP_ID=MMETSP0107_2-20121207/43342_1 /TAXON_ID=195067 ORGANISM="Goniomonas pacifica, Strain CCMP1869" /NCGR_SAMPLE_ID=MMETSP0107_2 /ASSEMBLY_ACC=CAM_ASM_000203 /LENGTH=54 /DNA_ID=CAMNT_0017202231 /DNA_START=215 /DNA_END=379 /DNA_ORIENTATION=-
MQASLDTMLTDDLEHLSTEDAERTQLEGSGEGYKGYALLLNVLHSLKSVESARG